MKNIVKKKYDLLKLFSFFPFIAMIFYGFWNIKIYLVLNSIIFIAFILLVFHIYKKKYFFFTDGYQYFFAAIVLSLISFLLSPLRNLISLEYINFLSGFIIFFITLNIQDNDRDIKYFYPFLFIIVLISAYNLISGDDVIATLKNSNTLAFFSILIIGMLLEKRKYYAALIFFCVLISTRSIAGMLSVVLVSSYYCFNNRKNIDFKNNKIVLSIVLLLIVFLVFNIDERSVSDRINWWRSSFDMFKERPLVGWGYSGFTHLISAFSSDGPKSLYAHNYFIETLAEEGIIFFAVWFYFLFLIIKRSKNFYHYALLSALLQSLFDFGIDTTCGWWFFMYVLAESDKKDLLMFRFSNNGKKITSFIITLSSLVFLVWLYSSFKYIDIEKRLGVISELANNNRYDLAVAYSDDSISKNPDNFDIALKRALVLEDIAEITRDKRAYMDLAKSLEYILIINPYYKRAYDKLEKIYDMIGDERLITDLRFRKKNYIQADK